MNKTILERIIAPVLVTVASIIPSSGYALHKYNDGCYDPSGSINTNYAVIRKTPAHNFPIFPGDDSDAFPKGGSTPRDLISCGGGIPGIQPAPLYPWTPDYWPSEIPKIHTPDKGNGTCVNDISCVWDPDREVPGFPPRPSPTFPRPPYDPDDAIWLSNHSESARSLAELVALEIEIKACERYNSGNERCASVKLSV